jgi:FkbM family methyltransferase
MQMQMQLREVQNQAAELATRPVLSVIIPVFNMERYVGQCLSSVLRLQDPITEVIVVDDGSTDRTGQVLHSFNDPRLTVLRTSNRGPSAARNTGLACASGTFVLPFDADDIAVVENWKLTLDTLMANPDAVVAYGARRVFQGSSDDFPLSLPRGMQYPAADKFVPLIFQRNVVHMGTAAIRRETLTAAGGFNESLRFGEDWDLWCRLACLGRFIFCPAVMKGSREHPESATGAPVRFDSPNPALAAIEAIYSSPLVKQKLGDAHMKIKKRAVAWHTYDWGARLVRNRAFWPGAREILSSAARDPSLIIYLWGYPKRRMQRAMDALTASSRRDFRRRGIVKRLVPTRALPLARQIKKSLHRLDYRIIREDQVGTFPVAQHIRAIIRDRRIDLIFDVGANEGQFGKFLREEVGYAGNIISFEPVPATFAALQRAAWGDQKWKVHQTALGRSPGSLSINVAAASVFSSFRNPSADNLFEEHNRTIQQLDVEVTSVDAFVEAGQLEFKSAYLKTDTQGFDLEVLAGSSRTMGRIEAIQSEVSLHPIYDDMPPYEDVLQMLTEKGFKLSGMYPVSLSNLQAIEFDCILVKARPFQPGLHNSYEELLKGHELHCSQSAGKCPSC